MAQKRFHNHSLQPMKDKVAVITGSTGGIGSQLSTRIISIALFINGEISKCFIGCTWKNWKVDGSELIPGNGRGPMAYEGQKEYHSRKLVERAYGNSKFAQI